jgi:uncharacterized SAM-binding protein YcdF (DUF218 family)
VSEHAEQRQTVEAALSGATIAVLAAVTGHMLGIQQLIRIPDLALYLPAGVVGAAIGGTRLRPLIWIAAVPLAVAALVVAYTPLVRVAGAHFIRRDKPAGSVDAVVVLGAGLTADGMMKHETLDRLLGGTDLLSHGAAPVMFLSRERRDFGSRIVSDSADQTRVLAMTNVGAHVAFTDSVLTTRTEALRTKQLVAARGVRSIALVTSPLHSRRSCATFEAVGFRVVCTPAPARESGMDPNSSAEERMRAFRSLLYETFATATYKSNGWIR